MQMTLLQLPLFRHNVSADHQRALMHMKKKNLQNLHLQLKMHITEKHTHEHFIQFTVLLPEVCPAVRGEEGETEEQPLQGPVRRERRHQQRYTQRHLCVIYSHVIHCQNL